jgi:hypothetical protein
MTNTSAAQDRLISAAEDFAQRNECATEHINALIDILNDLDDQLSTKNDELTAALDKQST